MYNVHVHVPVNSPSPVPDDSFGFDINRVWLFLLLFSIYFSFFLHFVSLLFDNKDKNDSFSMYEVQTATVDALR